MFHLTQNASFWSNSSQPICWHSTEQTKSNTTKTNDTGTKWQKHTKSKPTSEENLKL